MVLECITVNVVLASTEHDAAQGFTTIMLWFVLPLVAITLVAVTAYEIGLLRGRGGSKKPQKTAGPPS